MSDLSLPPLEFLPPEDRPTRATTGHGPFAWPTPPIACYPAPSAPGATEGCELEGLNSKVIAGRLMEFDPRQRQIRLRVAGSRSVVTLRFDQFRRLKLQSALPPLPPRELPVADALALRPEIPFAVTLKGGETLEGVTVGHHEYDFGLFLFEPADGDGSVRRSFIPAEAIDHSRIGPRLGEALVEQHLATEEDVDLALAQQRALRSQRVGEILLLREIVTHEELAEAIEQQARMPMVRIGEALIALGFITEAQLEDALRQQRSDRSVALGELLVRNGVITRDDLQTALARKMGYPLVDVTHFPCDAAAVNRLPYAVATRMPALPLVMHGGRLVVALEDPSRRRLLDELEFAAQCKVVPVLARTGVLPAAVDRAYEKMGALEYSYRSIEDAADFGPEDAGKLLASLELQGAGDSDDDFDGAIEQSDNSLVRLINTMIMEAQQQGVSDIHIETQPGREKVRIRFRKDGLLRPYLELPPTYRGALIARLKIMCDLDISEKRKPQDGKINFSRFVPGQRLELRVATIPTHDGLEDAVLRLLASVRPLPLDRLNLSETHLERLKTAIARPYGMVLCVGPTGSGKTTTLHSCLGHINTPDRKIWTAEDPIEITQAGLRQVQVNPKIDWTFAKALRAFLRADPDVVMVGEIRDAETAQMAIEASLTGHLVLSTLHTNSAAETVTRLLDMGMDPFNFADSLLAVLAQRLVRRLCTDCRAPVDNGGEVVDELLRDWRHAGAGLAELPSNDALLADWRRRHGGDEGRLVPYRPVGCPRCDGTGYRGRTGLHELMPVSRALKALIQTGRRADELLSTAMTEGMRTLRQDGIEKVVAGATTLDEVRAVTNG